MLFNGIELVYGILVLVWKSKLGELRHQVQIEGWPLGKVGRRGATYEVLPKCGC